MEIFQKEITLKSKSRGFHLITNEILEGIPEIVKFKKGLINISIQHTSAGLTINENADPTVREDFETFFNRLIPEDTTLYKHIFEGPDDMTSHIKSSLLGSSVQLSIQNGKFCLGTWQGINLCEFRDKPHTRRLFITIIGEKV